LTPAPWGIIAFAVSSEKEERMATTVTIYNTNGTVAQTISNPTEWAFDQKSVFIVSFSSGGNQVQINTTLPVLVQTTS
jgi:hypothetical protein